MLDPGRIYKIRVGFFFTISLILLTGCASNQYTVMTYNIRHGVGMDRVLDLQRVAKVINAANPDILILNEVDHGTVRAFGVLQTDSLGKLLDMDATFGRSIDYDSGEYGNALLTKFPVLDFQVTDLSMDSLFEGRSVFQATLLAGADTLVVLGTHLGLDPKERLEQVERIITVLPKISNLILGGDFNFEPQSPPYERVIQVMHDGVLKVQPIPENTFPADHPDRRIDYLFVGQNIEVLGAPILKLDLIQIASDHRPQLIQFRIKKGED